MTFGGDGLASSITGSSVVRGGGGGGYQNSAGTDNTGAGGGGKGANAWQSYDPDISQTAGGANTGGGGGGGSKSGGGFGASGGSGVVILRVPTASYSNSTTGSPTVSTSGDDTIMVFTGSGSYKG